MRLFEAYNKALIGEFWGDLENNLLIDEDVSSLKDLITQANELVFKKFKVNPGDRRYSIVGSARLHLYPELREAFELPTELGDLDIVIPSRADWVTAELEDEYDSDGIYIPDNSIDIEVFNEWAPHKAGEKYADINVRDTVEIIKSSTKINGYFFMSFEDIIDYKVSMDRDKEKDLIKLIKKYQKSGKSDKIGFLRTMAKIIGFNETKEFLGNVKD